MVPALGCIAGPAPLAYVAIHLGIAAALALTGPGAISLDALMFGRRTVILTTRDDTKV
jgi:hypothetical protein